MSKHCTFPTETEGYKRAIEKAKHRGDAAKEWLKTHELTIETQSEFNALMKSVDKKWIEGK